MFAHLFVCRMDIHVRLMTQCRMDIHVHLITKKRSRSEGKCASIIVPSPDASGSDSDMNVQVCRPDQAERSSGNCQTPAGTALRLVRPTPKSSIDLALRIIRHDLKLNRPQVAEPPNTSLPSFTKVTTRCNDILTRFPRTVTLHSETSCVAFAADAARVLFRFSCLSLCSFVLLSPS